MNKDELRVRLDAGAQIFICPFCSTMREDFGSTGFILCSCDEGPMEILAKRCRKVMDVDDSFGDEPEIFDDD